MLLVSSRYSQEEKHLYKQHPVIPSIAILKGSSLLSLHPLPPPIPPSSCPSISPVPQPPPEPVSASPSALEEEVGHGHPVGLLLLRRFQPAPQQWAPRHPLVTNSRLLLLKVIPSCLGCYFLCQEVRQATVYPAEEVTCTGKNVMYSG